LGFVFAHWQGGTGTKKSDLGLFFSPEAPEGTTNYVIKHIVIRAELEIDVLAAITPGRRDGGKYLLGFVAGRRPSRNLVLSAESATTGPKL